MRQAYTFDDVLLVPKKGVLEARKDADISSELVAGYKLDVPIISANMPSVTDSRMANAMYSAGGFGILHRFHSLGEQIREYEEVLLDMRDAAVSIGLVDGLERTKKLAACGCRIFCLDIAHGHTGRAYNFIKEFRTTFGSQYAIIAGNVATYEAAEYLINAGVHAIKVGIGPGAACRTREVTGFGVPQLTAIMEVARANAYWKNPVRIIADGGIKNSGDIVKALAAGADTVMIGSLLAGCNEAPNPGEYYGNASEHVNGHRAPEGTYGKVELTGSVGDVIKELAWGIRSGISYGGATNIAELRENAEFIQVTAAGQYESQTRLQELKSYGETFILESGAGKRFRYNMVEGGLDED